MMKSQTILLSIFIAVACDVGAATNDLPKFDEVYKLLRENLSGVNESDLDQAAVKGIIGQLEPRVSLARPDAEGDGQALNKTEIYDDAFVYFRVGRVGSELADKIAVAYGEEAATNKIKGVVLDLRFANGLDYAAAAATANLFINGDQPLLDWGTGSALATAKTNAISAPVAILVNRQTRGAAEALAAVLRDANVGLLLGSPTAGMASEFKEFTLSNGSKLRIATNPVKLRSDTELARELSPDIAVSVTSGDEKAYFTNAYAVLRRGFDVASGSPTNQADTATNRNQRRFNEAELVRQQREGSNSDDGETTPTRKKEQTERPLVTDPVLSRALDLLKGLAVVQQGVSSGRQR